MLKTVFFPENPENSKVAHSIQIAEKLTDVGNICDFHLDGKSFRKLS